MFTKAASILFAIASVQAGVFVRLFHYPSTYNLLIFFFFLVDRTRR